MALDRLAGCGEVGQELQLLPSMLDEVSLSTTSHHAAHCTGIFGTLTNRGFDVLDLNRLRGVIESGQAAHRWQTRERTHV